MCGFRAAQNILCGLAAQPPPTYFLSHWGCSHLAALPAVSGRTIRAVVRILPLLAVVAAPVVTVVETRKVCDDLSEQKRKTRVCRPCARSCARAYPPCQIDAQRTPRGRA